LISIIFLGLIIILLIQILLKLIDINRNYMIAFIISLFIIIFFINLKISMDSAIEGCKLWYAAILPTLFPFLVICNLLIAYDGISLYSKFLGPVLCRPLGLSKSCSFPLAASLLCGYPLGAKYCADVYNLGYIEKREYIRLLNIATNCGPLFILGPVSTALLDDIRFGYLLLIANYISPILIGLLTKKGDYKIKKSKDNIFVNKKTFGEIFKISIEKAINTTLSIGGFIIIFSVVIGIIKSSGSLHFIFNNIELFASSPKDSIYALFLGSLEITNGCNLIATSTFNFSIKLSIISFFCSFSGLCIIAQVSSFVSKDKISMLRYSCLKFLQGVISFVITFIISYFYLGSITTGAILSYNKTTLGNYMYFIPIIVILSLTIIFKILKKLFFHIS